MSSQQVRIYPRDGFGSQYGIGPVRWTPDPTRPVEEQQFEVHYRGAVYRFSPRDVQIAMALRDWYVAAPEGVDDRLLRQMHWRVAEALCGLAGQWQTDLAAWERDRDFVRAETVPAQQATAA